MRTVADIESWLKEKTLAYQDFGSGLFIVTDDTSGLRNLAIKVEGDVVIFNLRVMETPDAGAGGREALFERLLKLNGTGLLHCAFGIQDDGIYLQAALPLPNLDPNELQAVLDDIGMAASQHIPQLQTRNAN